MFDNRQIYIQTNLNNYITNDPIGIKDRALYEINLNKQRLLLEIQELKNG